MSPEINQNFGNQLSLGIGEFSQPVVISASRRTELVALRPDWLVNALKTFKGDIHSVVLWTKDPTNIYAHQELRKELEKHNVSVHLTITGLGGTRIEPTVPKPEAILEKLPDLLEFLGDTRRLRWRFDPIVTLKKEDGSNWSSSVFFEPLAKEMARLGADNCYFSFCKVYPKIRRRKLRESGIHIVEPTIDDQISVVNQMKETASSFGITLYSCAQPILENIEGIVPAKCIDGKLLAELHPQKLQASLERDKGQSKYRPACYCTESKDIGSYFPCGHGCSYCYAEAAILPPERLKQKPMPW